MVGSLRSDYRELDNDIHNSTLGLVVGLQYSSLGLVVGLQYSSLGWVVRLLGCPCSPEKIKKLTESSVHWFGGSNR